MNKIDNYSPDGKWKFDVDVSECFDDMLQRSIPGYEKMRELTLNIGSLYLKKEGISNVVDIGCSNGLSIQPFVNKFGAYIRSFLIDNSQPMVEQVKRRFAGWISCGQMHVECGDIVDTYPATIADLTLCILSLQFTPIEERQQILRKIYEHTAPGGALLLVEKVQGNSAEMDDILTEQYYEMKRANGYTNGQIIDKRRSLRGVLVDLKPEWNEQLIREAGFKTVQMYWRCLNFCGWVAVKNLT